MKQFKFRAWTGKELDFDIAVINGTAWKEENPVGDDVIDKNGRHYYTDWAKYNKKDLVLMQFTGLTDKLGTEIYEGDILQPSSYIKSKVGRCVVVFKKGMFCFDIIKPFITSIGPMSKSLSRGESANNEFVIIGNKFENPELLPSPPEAK